MVRVALPVVLDTDIRSIFLPRLFGIRISGSIGQLDGASFVPSREMATRRRNVLQVRQDVNRQALQFYPGGWLPLREKNLVYRRYYADVSPLKPLCFTKFKVA